MAYLQYKQTLTFIPLILLAAVVVDNGDDDDEDVDEDVLTRELLAAADLPFILLLLLALEAEASFASLCWNNSACLILYCSFWISFALLPAAFFSLNSAIFFCEYSVFSRSFSSACLFSSAALFLFSSKDSSGFRLAHFFLLIVVSSSEAILASFSCTCCRPSS
jgi:hypothetical protein